MDIIINASPIIFLSKIDRLWILKELFDTVYVPNAVLNEIRACGNTKTENQLATIPFEAFEVLNQTAVSGLLGRLHVGEVEVIIGAIEKKVTVVVLDDKYARNKARQLGLTVTGTLGLLLKAKKTGLIGSIDKDIEKLRRAGMYLSDEIIAKILS